MKGSFGEDKKHFDRITMYKKMGECVKTPWHTMPLRWEVGMLG